MSNSKLNIAFEGTSRAAIDPVLKAAVAIIPYFEYEESKSEGDGSSFSTSMHSETVVSFIGMLQELINNSGGSVAITDSEGDVVNLSKGDKDFHFGELEKKLQPVL